MKEKINLFLATIVITTLSLSIYDLFEENIKILQFISFSIFLWFVVSFSKSSKNGETFIFAIFSLLYNPFYTLGVIKENFETTTKLSILFLILYLIYNHKQLLLSLFKNSRTVFSEFSIKKYIKTITIIGVSLLMFFGVKQYDEYTKIEIKKIEQKRIDSIYKQQAKIQSEKNAINSLLICNKDIAYKNFKEHLEFYYPKWRIASKPNVKSDDYCKYKISLIVYEANEYYIDKESLVAEIDLNYDGNFKKYNIRFIQKPVLMR